MTTTDRDELVVLYAATLARFRAAQGILMAHGSTTVPTRAELRSEADARERMLELRRMLWPGLVHG